jgi:hypothetical protein
MFIIRYLIAAFITIVIALMGGSTMGCSLWQSIGIAFVTMVFLQIVILAYVVVAMVHTIRASQDVVLSKDTQESSTQLFILPK